MRQAPGESVQKVCPSCSTLAYTGDRRCPWCGAGYKRRLWGPLLALLLVQTALALGGVAYMLTVFGDEVHATLDDQVANVQRDLDESFDDVRRSLREELDRRLPEDAPAP
jgi:RNA polymerase subunit RPABC4/transcription elongation factor Spt4